MFKKENRVEKGGPATLNSATQISMRSTGDQRWDLQERDPLVSVKFSETLDEPS